MSKVNSIKFIISAADFGEVVKLWNIYSENRSQGQDFVYLNDDETIDELFPKSSDFNRATNFGHYEYMDKYFWVNHYGKLESFSGFCRYCPINMNILADYLIDIGDTTFPIDDVRLVDDFLLEYFENSDDEDKAKEIIDRICQSEPMDFLMEEWDDLYEEIKSHWND